jgi:hypothetical protein
MMKRDGDYMSRKGRRPIGGVAMTPAERQRRCRQRYENAKLPRGSEQAFRLSLWRFIVQARALEYKDLPPEVISLALDQLGIAVKMDNYERNNGHRAEWVGDFLTGNGLAHFYGIDPYKDDGCQ